MKRIGHIIQVAISATSMTGGHFSAWLIFLLMCMVLVETLTRYILRSPLALADEIGGYMLVAITFMGLAYTWKERQHVRIQFVVNRLPIKLRKWLRLITLVIATALVIVLIHGSYNLIAYSAQFGVRSQSWMRMPLVWPQVFLIVGSFLLLFQLFFEFVKAMRAVRVSEEEAE